MPTNRDADAPYDVPAAVWIVLVVILISLGALTFYAWRVQGDGLAALEATVSLIGLGAAFAFGLYAYAQFREWAAENHRFAYIDLWIEIANDEHKPGVRLPAVTHENELPDEPMFTLAGTEAVVRAVVHVKDRFPLRNCTLNVVVPDSWSIHPLRETANHRTAGTVTPNARVNPNANEQHGVRFTIWSGDLSPRQYFAVQVRISEGHLRHKGPFRLMMELSSTPTTESESDSFRFALLGPAALTDEQEASMREAAWDAV